MKLILFLISILCISCGNNYHSKESKSFLNLAKTFTEKHEAVFLSKDEKIKSYLLNQLVTNRLTKQELFKDKFYIDNKELVTFEKDNISYIEFKNQKMAKLYVCIDDKIFIYYLPEKVDLNKIETELNLPKIEGNIYSWVWKSVDYTRAGDMLILINTNMNEVLENDKRFYVEKIEYNENLVDLTVASKTSLHFNIKTNFKIQKTKPFRVVKKKTPIGKNFYRECAEANTCDCTYLINRPVDEWEEFDIENMKNVIFDILIGEELISSSEMRGLKKQKNQFTYMIDINNFEYSKDIMKFSMKNYKIKELNRSYDFSDSDCANITEENMREVISDHELIIEKKGRGVELIDKIHL